MFASTKIGDLYYSLNETNKTAKVTYELYRKSTNYKGLTTANIPASVTYGGQTYSVTSIDESAFYGCSGLTSVTIPNSITSIGYEAFFHCSGLTSITIPNSVTSIGRWAFNGCSSLKSITIGNSVISIGEGAFSYCSGVTSVTWNAKNCSDSGGFGSQVTSFTFGNKVETIPGSCCEGMNKLTSITIPNSVTSIGQDAFYNCSGLTSVTIPNSVTSIGGYAFNGCSGLTSVTLGNGVTNIGTYPFKGCSGLTSPIYNAHVFAFMPKSYSGAYTILNGIKVIASYAFDGCSGLTSITIPNSVTSIGQDAFRGCSGLTSVTWNAKNGPSCNFGNQVTSFTFGDEVENIPAALCKNMTKLTKITIPNSVTSIGQNAFYGCSSLTSITIPNSVTSIGEGAFSYCSCVAFVTWNAKNCSDSGGFGSQVISFTFGNKVETIPGSCCKGMDRLTSITIPNSVTSIGQYAFYNCSGLTSVTMEADTPPTLGSYALGNTNDCPIYVPCGTIDVYEAAWGITRITHSPSTACMYTISTASSNPVWGTTAGDKSVPYLENVVISATSNYGYHFVKWNDNNTENPRTISAVKDVTYTATFAKNTYSITKIANSTQGSISGVSQAEYLDNVTLTATPQDGYHFSQWSDGITTNPRTFVLTQDTTFTAEFARNPTITYVYDSQMGNVTGPATTATGIAAENITFNATPNYGYHFVQWSDGNTENPRTIWLSQDTTFTAEFAKNSYTISTTSANPEWGTTDGNTTALYLDKVEISAIPNYGYHFVKWNIEKYQEHIEYGSLLMVKFSVPETWSNPYAWIWETGGDGHWETLSYEKGMYVYRTEQNNMNIIVVPNGPEWDYGQTNDLAITESCCYTISGEYEDSNNSWTNRNYATTKNYDCFSAEEQALIDKFDTITYVDTTIITNTTNPLLLLVTQNKKAIAYFAKNVYSITKNAGHGSISGNSSAEYLDHVTLSVSSDYGYHFTQWSDGNTNNPRTFVLTRDTTFTAEFAIDKSGTCGKNNLLHWTFADDGTLTISGSGELTENYTFGVEAPTQMQQLVVGNEVTSIGERAFYEKTTLQKLIIGSNVTSIGKYAFASINNRQLTSLVLPAELLTIGDYAFSGNTYVESIDFNAKLQSIGAYAFKDCYRVSEMTCLATVTPNVGTDALASINSYASLCVPAECLRKYQVDPNWGRFDLCELGTTSTVTENRTVTVEPTDNTAIFTWPTENNAASYLLKITKDGVVFCTLVFNSNGQLTGIAFAPGRNGAAHAPAATMSVAGMSFTVTGLDGASKYAYRLAVTNDASEELVAYSGEFATTGYDGEVNPGGIPEGLDNTPFPSGEGRGEASKILRNGQIFILRGEKVYTVTGQEVK